MIIRARIVAPMEGEPIEDGAVAVEANKITGVGRFAEVKADHSGEVLDLGEQILLPGLINAHCHLDYTILRGQVAPRSSFADWIRAINEHKAALNENDYVDSIAAGLAEARKFGTTTLLNLEAFPELLPRLPRPLLRVWWCAELIDIRKSVNVQRVSDALRDWFRTHPDWLGGLGLAPHAPYTASRQLYSDASEIARREGVPFTTHLAESREEMQMFRDASGPLFEFLKSIGRSMEDCGKDTPLSLMLRHRMIEERWIIAHLNELEAGDFALLESAPKFHIASCPRSHAYFGHAPLAFQRLRALGFNICLGTDSLASNSSLNLFDEMRDMLRQETWLSPQEVVAMATRNGAGAIGQSHSLGRIRPGFLADLIAVPEMGSGTDVFESVVAFEQTVSWMMVNGEMLSAP